MKFLFCAIAALSLSACVAPYPYGPYDYSSPYGVDEEYSYGTDAYPYGSEVYTYSNAVYAPYPGAVRRVAPAAVAESRPVPAVSAPVTVVQPAPVVSMHPNYAAPRYVAPGYAAPQMVVPMQGDRPTYIRK